MRMLSCEHFATHNNRILSFDIDVWGQIWWQHTQRETHRHTDTAIHVRAKPWYTQTKSSCNIYTLCMKQTKTPFFTNNREIYRDTCRKTVKLCEEGLSVNPTDLLLFRIDTLIRAIYKNSFFSLWLVLLITAAFFFSFSHSVFLILDFSISFQMNEPKMQDGICIACIFVFCTHKLNENIFYVLRSPQAT